MALCVAISEGLWCKKLLNDFGLNLNKIIVFEDNQGCIALIKNSSNNRRVKHIDLKYRFICEHLQNGCIELYYVNSNDNQADIFTKGLPVNIFVNSVKLLNLV